MNKFYIENKEDLRVLIVHTARKKTISGPLFDNNCGPFFGWHLQ